MTDPNVPPLLPDANWFMPRYMEDPMPARLRPSEQRMWAAKAPTQVEVRVLLERISTLRAVNEELRRG